VLFAAALTAGTAGTTRTTGAAGTATTAAFTTFAARTAGHEFLGGELAVGVFVECFQGGGRVGNFVSRDDTVVVGILCGHEGGFHAGAAFTAFTAFTAWATRAARAASAGRRAVRTIGTGAGRRAVWAIRVFFAGTWRGWTHFLTGELAVIILVQRLQGGGGVGDFVGGEGAVFVGIEGGEDRGDHAWAALWTFAAFGAGTTWAFWTARRRLLGEEQRGTGEEGGVGEGEAITFHGCGLVGCDLIDEAGWGGRQPVQHTGSRHHPC
jgi:hypothetical protein